MENSPLNKAHQLERRATALLSKKKFDECIITHQNAVKQLQDALSLSENPHSRQSIELQIDHHQKQIDSLKIKKIQYENDLKENDTMKHKGNLLGESDTGDALQHVIYHTIENHDSLLELVMKRDESHSVMDSNVTRLSGTKREVDDSTIIEEFKVLSGKLRELVEILSKQVEERDLEIARLKAEIVKLECEKNRVQSKSNNSLRVITDSSGGTSPFVFSPCSELSPEVHDSRGLPILAPLGMPDFDFSQLELIKKTINSNNTTPN